MAQQLGQKCPIWGTDATVVENSSNNNRKVDSPRAGGCFEIRKNDMEDLQALLNTELQVKLTDWLVDQYKLDIKKPPLITNEVIEKAKSRRRRSPKDRADNLLRFLERQSTHIGSLIKFHYLDDLDPENESQREQQYLSAWSSSISIEETHFLIEYLSDSGYIKITSNCIDEFVFQQICVLVDGHAYLAQLKGPNLESQQGFVAMWFDDQMDEVYEHAIAPGVKLAGYKPVRIDRVEHSGKIDDEIIAQIKRSRFVVADFTGNRGGVYFEAGFALGMDLKVIWLCREGEEGKLHFDIRQFNHILWSPDKLDNKLDKLKQNISNRISAVVGDGPFKILPSSKAKRI